MIDQALAKQLGSRLKRISGQVRGLEKMIADQRYCVEVLDQIAAIQAALGGVGKMVLRNHVETCVAEALLRGNQAERQAKVDELADLYGRFCRAP